MEKVISLGPHLINKDICAIIALMLMALVLLFSGFDITIGEYRYGLDDRDLIVILFIVFCLCILSK